MKTLTVEQQIAALRPAAGFAAHMHRWFLLAAALGVVAAVVFRHPVPLMLSVFLAVVGLSEKRAGPNIVAAIAAYDSGTPTRGEAAVSITSWDTDQHYHAVVREPGHPDWEFEFVPQGWRPTERSYPARIWRNGGGLQPVLAAVEAGIMIPRYDPQRAGSATADPGFVR
jgi:hypothetical protein